jgi:hypothetical protein
MPMEVILTLYFKMYVEQYIQYSYLTPYIRHI